MIARKRTMFGAIGALASTGVLAGVLLATSGSAASAAPGTHQAARTEGVHQGVPRVPTALKPPSGNVLTAQFTGTGVQVYQCTAGAWVFVEPAANLVGHGPGRSHIQTAVHYKGPTWESTTDGSLVQGATVVSSPVSGSIPQLLLKATANRGTGIFGRATFINRLDTRGGAAPAGSCTSGQTTGVPYTAQYLFYAPVGR